MNPFEPLQRIVLRNRVAHDTAALYFSHLLAAAMGFAVALIVARKLGPAEFGLISAYLAIVEICIGFTDFGLGTGLIKFTTPLVGGDRGAAAPFFRAALYAEVAAGVLVLVIGLSLSGLLVRFVGHDLPHGVVRLAVIAAAITSTGAYVGASLAAHKQFKRSAAISFGASFARLLVVLVLLAVGAVSLYNVLYAFAAAAFAAAAVGFALTPRDYAQPVVPGAVRSAAVALFKFSGWLSLTFVITSVMARLDFFYLYRLRGSEEAGVYAAAIQLSLAFTILIGSLTTVLTPYVSERTTYAAKIALLKRLMPVVAGLGGLLVLSMLAMPFVVEVLFGDKYSDAVAPLRVLMVHLAINVVVIPISLTYVPLGRVWVGTLNSALQLVIAFVLYPILIRADGSVGAALTVLINTIIGAVIYVVVLRHLLLREKVREEAAANAAPDQPISYAAR
jgi:O-antigen/teichoic acid export membrane protein